ncbi:MAG TPA: Holliday junction branch migration protein RuvA [Stellaceae bacterium]|jgi:holliday junction DNA helicase RuvA|nr:Holliday junction branch migration protein RuvA [Stellaceae bacterium]
MIAMLAGIVDQAAADGVVLDVNGVGYLVFASARTLARVPPRGEAVRLLIETHVREDHIHLYGFADEAERGWFRLLTTVQGVGAKLALALLSVLPPEALATAIMAQDKAALARADGVGQKLAQRIANELKDKVGGIALGPAATSAPIAAPPGAAADAVSALINLGYSRSDAYSAVNQAAQRLGAEARIDALIRAGLQELAR